MYQNIDDFSIKMINEIIKLVEESPFFAFIRELNDIFFGSQQLTMVQKDLNTFSLKNVSLELIRGIGPKTRMILENNGIKNLNDLLKASNTIPGISVKRVEAWKQAALQLA